MSDEKRAIRQLLRQQRQRLSEEQTGQAGAAVSALLRTFAPFADAVSVVGYLATDNEVPTARLLTAAAAVGHVIYLPRHSHTVELVEWRPGDRLRPGRGGVLEPVGAAVRRVESPAIALVPLVAWNHCGLRLGRGGGFYDRLFSRITEGVTRVGLGYEFQEYERLPRDPWDVPLHYVITERRIVDCSWEQPWRPLLLQKGGLQP